MTEQRLFWNTEKQAVDFFCSLLFLDGAPAKEKITGPEAAKNVFPPCIITVSEL